MHSLTFEMQPFVSSGFRIARWQVAAWACAMLVFLSAYAQFHSRHSSLADITRFDIGESSDGDVVWSPVDFAGLSPLEGLTYFRIEFDVPAKLANAGEPLALYLSGSFSSSVEWNGTLIGDNGVPADSAAAEIPGLIDSVFFIPREILNPGKNTALVALSSHRLAFPVGNILQRIAVGPYSGDARRSLREYAAPVISLGGVLFAAFALWNLPLKREAKHRIRLAGALMLLAATAAGAEVSRALLNYPYPFHGLRMSALALAIAAFAAGFVYYAAIVCQPARARTAAMLSVAAIGLAYVYFQGWDTKIYAAVMTGAGLATGIGIYGAFRRNTLALHIILAALPFLILGITGPDIFLDRNFYVAMTPFFANIYLLERADGLAIYSQPAKPAPQETIVFSDRGRTNVVQLSEISAVKAAGNYAEIFLSDGGRMLVSETLNAVHGRLSPLFLRTHRSHILNLNEIAEIKCLSAGKFEAALKSGIRAPVSRTRVKELRDAVAGNLRSPQTLSRSRP